jgi:hypothetical protein
MIHFSSTDNKGLCQAQYDVNKGKLNKCTLKASLEYSIVLTQCVGYSNILENFKRIGQVEQKLSHANHCVNRWQCL